jgi:superfamily I DNA/RNA helicase
MILSTLNDEQKRAVQQDGNVLLTACPGSGKTRVIIHKLAYEASRLDNNTKKKIIALTFTNRAAEEIFRRLNSMGIQSDRIWSGTLHAFCLEWIIRPYSCYLPELRNGFTIADESFCSELLSKLKTKHKLKQIDPVCMRFNRDGTFAEPKTIQKRLLAEYHQTLRDMKLIDFDLMLLFAYRILANYPKVQKTLSNLLRLICVDEYQDTQDLLYAIISLIVVAGEGKTSLFLVGDSDQAIYASLGGIAKTISEIKAEIRNMPISELTLEGNYRSNQRIIDYYSHFQTQRIAIKAVGRNTNQNGYITLNCKIHHSQIVPEVARLIQCSLERGVSENEICVIVPQWWLITSVAKHLRAALPHVHFDASGLAPMSRNRDNIWYKLSRLFLTEPSPKIYSARYRWATELIDNFRLQTFTDFTAPYGNARDLLRLVNSISSTETEGIDYIIDCFHQFLEAVNVDYIKHPELMRNWQLFFDNIRNRLSDPEFKVPSDIQSFKSFYREISGVVINTCVGVKGEEFETVIAYGLLHGYIPHWNEIFTGDPISASKKLMYVICSRAKNNLHLICESGRATKSGYPLEMNKELKANRFCYDEL